MTILENLKNKSILILGLGREGISSYLFLRKHFPDKILALSDQFSIADLTENSRTLLNNDPKVKLILGRDYLDKSNGFDVIFVTSGISEAIVKKVIKPSSTVLSNTQLFFELFKGKIIGATGTKGKSTTASLIFEVLKGTGRKVLFGGNIGKPALSLLEGSDSDSLAVLELSSYQLMRVNRSPYVAVIQNIVLEHLDYHGDFLAYINAKENIVKYQKEDDWVIYNASSKTATDIALKSKAKKIPFTDYSKDLEKSILPVDKIPLRGKFNLKNVIPAIIIGRMFDVPDKGIRSAILGFRSLEHRMEYVKKVNGVGYYNDSLSTIPESAIAALDAFSDQYKVLILGGYDRGLNFASLAKSIYLAKIRGIILFPTTGEKIWKEVKKVFKDKELPLAKFVNNMQGAVNQANQWAKSGDVVLLSPASPSFSVFKNYEDRGNQFKKEVNKLIEK